MTKKRFSLRFPLIDIRLKHRLLAALSYLHILVLIPFFFSGKNKLARFHSRQGIVLLCFLTLGLFLFWLPFLGWVIVLIAIIGIIWGLSLALRGKEKPLPLASRFLRDNL